MGITRLLAKGWIVFCLFAGAHAFRIALISGMPPASSGFAIGICVLLFIAMGLLFAGGYGVSGVQGGVSSLARIKPRHLVPGFNEIVFLVFVVISFVNQTLIAPGNVPDGVTGAFERAIFFAIPGQRALYVALSSCTLDGGRLFASAVAWLLAVIYLASTASRLRLVAGIIRLESDSRPESLGPTIRAFLLGAGAVVGIQFLFVGSAYPWLKCSAFDDITGSLLIGLAPLMLAYLIVAALASLLASNSEK